MQAEAARVIAIMGGKFPHFMTSLPGGTAWVPTEEKLDDILFRLAARSRTFVDNTMIPDTLAIAPFYTDALSVRWRPRQLPGVGRLQPRVARAEGPLPAATAPSCAGSLTVEDADPAKVKEYVKHSWFDAADGGLNPAEGKTNPEFTEYDVNDKYSWAKAPRYNGKPMEVGPLSRMLVAYLARRRSRSRRSSTRRSRSSVRAGKPEVLVSLLGRVAARNLETAVVADWSIEWVNELVAAVKGGDVKFFEAERADDGDGAGLWEAPRGAVGHWMTVKGGKIANYQICTPSTWNIGGRDDDGVRGVMEEALIGAPVVDPTKPLEAAAHRPQLRSLNRLRRSRD